MEEWKNGSEGGKRWMIRGKRRVGWIHTKQSSGEALGTTKEVLSK